MHARGERELLLGVQERERNGNKKTLSKFRKGKEIKKKHSHILGTGSEAIIPCNSQERDILRKYSARERILTPNILNHIVFFS